jgi:plastocyanin
MAAMKNWSVALPARAVCICFAAVLAAACGSGAGPGWTYAPLGPTPSTGAGASAAPSPGGTQGLPIDVATPPDQPLAFVPSTLEAPAATLVTVNYNNNSNLPHNIDFFDGPDNTAPSLGATEIVTGPNAPRSVTFTTPSSAGDYFFWCDVHGAAMVGTLRVAQ